MYKCEFTNSFRKDIKKVSTEVQEIVLNKWVEKICIDPTIGKKFKSPKLKHVYRIKFRYKKCDYRIVYSVNKKILKILFVAVGPRENFYKRLETKI